ncbi:hypothetical protein [Streptosporangium sp. NPDC000239]|uniref:DUF779 domain-containing protein n=1 Tax=Streptosporangium jomthongense TaxID=1193683 RepID=A0ABV8FAB6_9ACTN
MSPSERPLSADERAVILALLARDFPGAEDLRRQVPSVVVTRNCGCGCATIDFRTEDEPPTLGKELVSSAYVRGRDDGVLLFVRHGRLSHLEVYSSDGDPAPLPRVEDLVIDPPDTWE